MCHFGTQVLSSGVALLCPHSWRVALPDKAQHCCFTCLQRPCRDSKTTTESEETTKPTLQARLLTQRMCTTCGYPLHTRPSRTVGPFTQVTVSLYWEYPSWPKTTGYRTKIQTGKEDKNTKRLCLPDTRHTTHSCKKAILPGHLTLNTQTSSKGIVNAVSLWEPLPGYYRITNHRWGQSPTSSYQTVASLDVQLLQSKQWADQIP